MVGANPACKGQQDEGDDEGDEDDDHAVLRAGGEGGGLGGGGGLAGRGGMGGEVGGGGGGGGSVWGSARVVVGTAEVRAEVVKCARQVDGVCEGGGVDGVDFGVGTGDGGGGNCSAANPHDLGMSESMSEEDGRGRAACVFAFPLSTYHARPVIRVGAIHVIIRQGVRASIHIRHTQTIIICGARVVIRVEAIQQPPNWQLHRRHSPSTYSPRCCLYSHTAA